MSPFTDPGSTLFSLALGFAVVFGWRWCWRPAAPVKSVVKTLSTLLLAAASVPLGAPWMITLGLALGAAGDLALSRPGQRSFLIGMAAFAAGHLVYAWVFFEARAGWVILVPAVLVVLLALSTEIWLTPRTGALRWPVRAYVATITLMMLAALTLSHHALLVIAGAALFFLSDVLLALEIFVLRAPGKGIARAVWAAYWTGQALIALGAGRGLGPFL